MPKITILLERDGINNNPQTTIARPFTLYSCLLMLIYYVSYKLFLVLKLLNERECLANKLLNTQSENNQNNAEVNNQPPILMLEQSKGLTGIHKPLSLLDTLKFTIVDNQPNQLASSTVSSPINIEVIPPLIHYMEEGERCRQCHKGTMELSYHYWLGDQKDETTEERSACFLCTKCSAKPRLSEMDMPTRGLPCPECLEGTLERAYAVNKQTGRPYHCLYCNYFGCNILAYRYTARHLNEDDPCDYCSHGIMELKEDVNGIYGRRLYLECSTCTVVAFLDKDKIFW